MQRSHSVPAGLGEAPAALASFLTLHTHDFCLFAGWFETAQPSTIGSPAQFLLRADRSALVISTELSVFLVASTSYKCKRQLRSQTHPP